MGCKKIFISANPVFPFRFFPKGATQNLDWVRGYSIADWSCSDFLSENSVMHWPIQSTMYKFSVDFMNSAYYIHSCNFRTGNKNVFPQRKSSVFLHCKKKWVVLTHFGYLSFIPVSMSFNNFSSPLTFTNDLETQNKFLICLESKAGSGTSLCLMMQTIKRKVM